MWLIKNLWRPLGNHALGYLEKISCYEWIDSGKATRYTFHWFKTAFAGPERSSPPRGSLAWCHISLLEHSIGRECGLKFLPRPFVHQRTLRIELVRVMKDSDLLALVSLLATKSEKRAVAWVVSSNLPGLIVATPTKFKLYWPVTRDQLHCCLERRSGGCWYGYQRDRDH